MSKFQFLTKGKRFKARIPVLLDRMANNAVYQFKVTNFDASGFVDGSVNRWVPNQKSDSRQQLVKTGRMRESIRKLSGTFWTRLVGSDVPYAEYHNSGTGRLPKRQFVGESKQLLVKNGKLLLQTIKTTV